MTRGVTDGLTEEVTVRLAARLPERDHESLRTTYERMLERGPERFQVKPSGVPDMAALYDALPNFHGVLDDVRRHVALSQDSADGLEVTPMLLLVPRSAGGGPSGALSLLTREAELAARQHYQGRRRW